MYIHTSRSYAWPLRGTNRQAHGPCQLGSFQFYLCALADLPVDFELRLGAKFPKMGESLTFFCFLATYKSVPYIFHSLHPQHPFHSCLLVIRCSQFWPFSASPLLNSTPGRQTALLLSSQIKYLTSVCLSLATQLHHLHTHPLLPQHLLISPLLQRLLNLKYSRFCLIIQTSNLILSPLGCSRNAHLFLSPLSLTSSTSLSPHFILKESVISPLLTRSTLHKDKIRSLTEYSKD